MVWKVIHVSSSDGDADSDTQSDASTGARAHIKGSLMHDPSTTKIFKSKLHPLQAANEGWAIFAVHPEKGKFIVNEGVNLVGDEEIVSGGVMQGFFSAPIPSCQKWKIEANACRGYPTDTALFSNLHMVTPRMTLLVKAVFDLAYYGPVEITNSSNLPDDVVLPVPPPRRNYSILMVKQSQDP